MSRKDELVKDMKKAGFSDEKNMEDMLQSIKYYIGIKKAGRRGHVAMGEIRSKARKYGVDPKEIIQIYKKYFVK